MVRKGKDVSPAMPKKQLNRIKKAFRRNNGIIWSGPEAEKHLLLMGAEASTINENTIVFPSRPSRAAVFEELIHATQYRLGKNDGSELSQILCEIEANEKLLKNSKAYKLSKKEVDRTQKNLNVYKCQLQEYCDKKRR